MSKYFFLGILFFPVLLFAAEKKKVRTIYMDDMNVAEIKISAHGSVLSFPIKPSKVIMGRQKNFDIEYVENDIAVAPLASDAKANMFVYLFGKRYAFSLAVSPGGGDDIILIRDKAEQLMRVKTHD